ncbi:flagellar transcriptional regulator FlhD [Halomonas binhaiensis]|uniref:Flagellar transcriptional regulator FlhD n=1 Tax=Halomonas binhaiensis TaxID=2562282 RepID=A0A5C1NMW7_9GAMM|nr:flagellar transcriptional regulator FlhD [Halomonas binhaiensis]QEM83797.1 flagellar transcriptional regulator FlhD [Halomonas binhaiensis]
MSSTTLINEIQELNLAYLLLAQRLLAEDRDTAMLRLNIDPQQASLLANLNARQLTRLSRTTQLLCHLGVGSAEQLRQITDNPREQGLSHIHSSLLMATPSATPMS